MGLNGAGYGLSIAVMMGFVLIGDMLIEGLCPPRLRGRNRGSSRDDITLPGEVKRFLQNYDPITSPFLIPNFSPTRTQGSTPALCFQEPPDIWASHRVRLGQDAQSV
jgi:hypothetical protein